MPNLQFQVRGNIIADMYLAVRALKTKLCLWKTQNFVWKLELFSVLPSDDRANFFCAA